MFPGVGSFNSFNTSPSLFSQQLSAGKHAFLLKDASKKGRWRHQRAAETVLENEAEGRRMLENVLKGGLGRVAGSSLEADLSEEMSEDGCRAGSSLEPDLSKEVSEDGCCGSVSSLGRRDAQSVLRLGPILPVLSHSLCAVSLLMIVFAPRLV